MDKKGPVLAGDPPDATVDETGVSDKTPLQPLAAIEPEDAPTVAVEPLPAGADDWEELGQAFARELEAAADDPERQAGLHYQLAVALEARRGDPHLALIQLQRALALAPANLSYIRAAQRVYRARRNWLRLVLLLDAELALTVTPAERARLWRQKARVYEAWLLDDASARSAYQEALVCDPGDLTALQGIRQLLERTGDHEALVDVLRRTIAVSEDRRLRALRYAQIGAIQSNLLGDESAARHSLSAAHAEDPSNEQVRNRLKQLLVDQRDWSALTDVLVSEAEASRGSQRIACYRRAAELARDRLGQPDRALQLLSRIYEEDDNDPAVLRELMELYDSTGRFEQLAEVYTRLLGHIGDEEAADVHYRLATVLDLQLNRPEDALEHCRRAVELAPRHPRAAFALRRTCRALGQWEELVQLALQGAADAELEVDRASRFAEAAEICERHLEDLPRAIKYYQRALSCCQNHGPSLLALESLYQRCGEYEQLLELLEKGLSARSTDLGASTLVRMAVICETLLQDPSRAAEYYRRAGEAQSVDVSLRRNVQRLLRDAGDHQELVGEILEENLGSPQPEEGLAWGLVAVRSLAQDLGRPDEAVARSEELVKRFPRHWNAVEQLAQQYESQGRWEALLQLWQQAIVAGAVPAAHQPTLHYHIGQLAERPLNQLEVAQKHYLAALERQKDSELPLRALERVYRQQQRWEALHELLLRQADRPTGQVGSRPARVLGQLCEENLDRAAEATEWYRVAVARDPLDERAREALLQRLTIEARTDEAVQVLQRAIEVCNDDDSRIALRVQLARLWLVELGQPGSAAETLESALTGSADDIARLSQIVSLYRQAGDHERTVRALERVAASTDDRQERARILIEAARLVELQLPDRDPAPLYEAALQHRPADRTILATLLQVYAQRADFAGLAHVVELMLPLSTAAEERAGLLLLSASCHERRGDALAAEEALSEAAKLPGQWVSAVELVRVRRSIGIGRALGDGYRQAANQSRDLHNASAMLQRAAQVYAREQEPEGVSRALDTLSQLSTIDPLDKASARQQEQLLRAAGDWQGAADAMRLRLDAARRFDGADSPEHRALRVRLLIRLARLQRDELQQAQAAAETLRGAHELDPHNVEALTLQAEIYGALDQWEEAADAYRQVVARSSDSALLALAHFQLGRIWQDRLANAQQAIAAFQNVLAVSPEDSRALRRLAQLFLASADWENAADTVERLLEVDREPAAQRQHHLTLADILEQGFGDPEAAAERLEMVLELDPLDEGVVERLASLRERLGDWQAECQLIERYLAALPAERRSAGAKQRMRLAAVLQRQRRFGDALEQYAEVVRVDSDHIEARLATAAICTEQGQYDRAIEVYRDVTRLEPLNQPALSQLRSIWSGLGNRELAHAAASVLVCCGLAGEGDRRVYRQYMRGGVRAPKSPIDDELFATIVRHPAEPLAGRALLEAISSVAHRLRPADLQQWQVGRGDRLGQRSEDPLRGLVRQVSHALGVRYEVEVYVSSARSREMDLLPTDPPALVIGRGAMTTLSSREIRCWIADLLAHVANGSWVAHGCDEEYLRLLVAASSELVSPASSLPGLQRTPESDEVARQLRRSLSRRGRRLLEDAVHALADSGDPIDFSGWALAIRCSALRAALWVVNDLAVALNYLRIREPDLTEATTPSDLGRALVAHPVALDLIRFWLSEDFQRAKRSIGS